MRWNSRLEVGDLEMIHAVGLCTVHVVFVDWRGSARGHKRHPQPSGITVRRRRRRRRNKERQDEGRKEKRGRRRACPRSLPHKVLAVPPVSKAEGVHRTDVTAQQSTRRLLDGLGCSCPLTSTTCGHDKLPPYPANVCQRLVPAAMDSLDTQKYPGGARTIII